MGIRNPTNGALIRRATLGDEIDAERAIAATNAVFSAWSQTVERENIEDYR